MGTVLGTLVGIIVAAAVKKAAEAAIDAAQTVARRIAKKATMAAERAAKKAAASAAEAGTRAVAEVVGWVAEEAANAVAKILEEAGHKIGEVAKEAAEAAGKKAAEAAIEMGKGTKAAVDAAAKAIEEYFKSVLLAEITEVAVEASAEAAAMSVANAATLEKITLSSKSSNIKDLTGFKYLNNFIKTFGTRKAVFVESKAMIPSNNEIMDEQLNKFVCVFEGMEEDMNKTFDWLNQHENDTVKLEKDYEKYGDLMDIMAPLIAGMGNLERLSNDVQIRTQSGQSMTETQLDSLNWCLDKVTKSFELLSGYMLALEQPQSDFELFQIYISQNEVSKWRSYLRN